MYVPNAMDMIYNKFNIKGECFWYKIPNTDVLT